MILINNIMALGRKLSGESRTETGARGSSADRDVVETARLIYIEFVTFQRDHAEALLDHNAIQSEFRRQIGYILAEYADSLRQGQIVLHEKKVALASTIGVFASSAKIPLDQLVSAWNGLFEIILPHIVTQTGSESAKMLGIRYLHHSVAERNRMSSAWFETALNQHIERCRTVEHNRIARELHDWFGSNLSIALRKLELYQLLGDVDGGPHLRELDTILAGMFDGARRFAADLRLSTPVSNIGADLRAFVEAANPDEMTVNVFVKGEETLVPAHVRSEVFISLREALRNALDHSDATDVTVMVDVSRERICAVVQDNGRGFVVPPEPDPAAGTGLISMRERIEQLDGVLLLSTQPMNGTRIDIWVSNREGDNAA
ncbi:sensor histidine kinase [Nocardia mexicana]|uniref:Histidine kinase n=1 Tax=Nocardia mexicana TaxID=279262 RepID=A0A370GRX4_9NOCA|nr:ATP-binding protein [Nocardia mexicana]RDI45244.1 histidine kinase [Nocardia mexicana]